MGWFKQIINNVIHKKASVEEVKTKALDLLQRGAPPSNVAMRFIMEMSGKDPSFARSPLVKKIMQSKDDVNTLIGLISGKPVAPVEPTPPPMGTVPPVGTPPAEEPAQPIQSMGPTLPEEPTQPLMETTPPAQPTQEIINPEVGAPEVEVVDQIPTGTIPVEGVPVEEEIQDEEMGALEPEGQDLFQNFDERLQQDNEDLQEEEGATSVYQNPTILESFSMPVDKMINVTKDLSKINKKLREIYHPEIKIEYEGDPYQKPVFYSDGTRVMEDFAKVKVSGKLPSPTDEIHIRTKKPLFWGKNYTGKDGVKHKKGDPMMEADGLTQKTTKDTVEPKGSKIFARINHHPLNEGEMQYFLKTESPTSKLRASIEGAMANNQVPFYNTITPIGKRYKWDDKFYFSKSQECFKCKAKQSRKSTYIAAIVPPENLVERTYKGDDGSGNMVDLPLTITRDMNYGVGKPDWQDVPAREIRDEEMEDAQQEQLGGSCATSYTEIKLVSDLEKLIQGWKKTSREIDENDVENAKEGKAPKERLNKPGGTRGYVPSERFFTVAIALMREAGEDGNIAGRLPYAISNYLDLIDLQNKKKPQQSGYMQRREERREERLKKLIPKITLDDQKISTQAIDWWRGRLGGLGLDDEDKNKVNLSILQTIDIGLRRKSGKGNIKSAVEMMQTYLAENNVKLEPYPEEVQTETDVETDKQLEAKPEEGVLDDIRSVEKGNSFVSKFKHKRSGEWERGGGFSHYFTDNRGKDYIIFDRYKKDPETGRLVKEPSMNFNQGEDYYIRGTKGDTGRYNTIIDNPKIVKPNQLQGYGGAEAPVEPEITPEAPITPATPEIAPEAPVEPEIAPEEIGIPPVQEEAPKPKITVKEVTQRAKKVIETGIDSRGKPMSAETLIPLYLDQLGSKVRGFKARRESYEQTLNEIYQKGGSSLLAKYMDTLEDYFKNYEI